MANLGSTILVPGVFVTVDNSLANTALGGTFKTVIIGQKTAAGTVTAETLVQVFGEEDAKTKAGVGSMLANQFSSWFDNNTTNEVYMIALDDAAASTANDQLLTITGTASASGTVYLYINGKLLQVGVASGDTATVIGDSIVTAITADPDLPCTAVNAVGVVTCTAKNKGTLGAQIDYRFNFVDGQSFPSGVGIAVSTLTAGATDPDINDAIAALPDEVFNLIINPYTDSTSLTALKTELDRRWGNTVQLDGHAVHGFSGTTSELVTKGDALNSEHFSIMDAGKDTMLPAYLVSSALGGRVAFSADADPARPFRTLPITGMVGDVPTDRRTFSDKNSILNAGLSTHAVQADTTVDVDRMVTTYKTNSVGAADTSYKNTNTMFNLSFMRQSFIVRMLSRYPRHKLADDGTTFGAGQPIATPSSIKGEIIALYEEWIQLGLAEDVDSFADTLVVERDVTNRSRVNVTMQPILVGQLYQFDTTLQFIV